MKALPPGSRFGEGRSGELDEGDTDSVRFFLFAKQDPAGAGPCGLIPPGPSLKGLPRASCQRFAAWAGPAGSRLRQALAAPQLPLDAAGRRDRTLDAASPVPKAPAVAVATDSRPRCLTSVRHLQFGSANDCVSSARGPRGRRHRVDRVPRRDALRGDHPAPPHLRRRLRPDEARGRAPPRGLRGRRAPRRDPRRAPRRTYRAEARGLRRARSRSRSRASASRSPAVRSRSGSRGSPRASRAPRPGQERSHGWP